MGRRLVGAVELEVLPERGLDVLGARFEGRQLAWLSGLGETPPLPADELAGERWRERWGGGLVTTCGLSNVGAPSEGHGLHGTYSHRPAEDLRLGEGEAAALVRDPPFRLHRTLRTDPGRGLVELRDVTVNDSPGPEKAPLLYHVNLAWGEGARLETDAREVVPRDAASEGPWDVPPEPEPGGPERVLEHVGATRARLVHAGVEVVVTSSLPRLWQWIHPDPEVWALALEPSNASVLGRADPSTPVMGPGERRESRLRIEVRSLP